MAENKKKNVKHGFTLLHKRTDEGYKEWLNLPMIKEAGYFDKAFKELSEEFYAAEVDKSLLETMAFYKTILDFANDWIKQGKANMESMNKDDNGFWNVRNWAEKNYFRYLKVVREAMPKKIEGKFSLAAIIKGM